MHVYLISNRVYIYLYQHRHHSRLFKQLLNTFQIIQTLFEHFSDRLEQCLNTFQISWNSVQTLFRLVGTLFKHLSNWLEQCSNTFQIGWNNVQTLFRLVGTLFKHFSNWWECLATVQTLVQSVRAPHAHPCSRTTQSPSSRPQNHSCSRVSPSTRDCGTFFWCFHCIDHVHCVGVRPQHQHHRRLRRPR